MSPRFPWLAGAVLAALLSLAACGPGTVGTGTGPDNTDYLALAGATPAPVCNAPWAERLACSGNPPMGGGNNQNRGGTQPVWFASVGSVAAADFVARFEGDAVVLEGGCPRQRFEGDWGMDAQGQSAFFGSLQSGRPSPTPEIHRLEVREAPEPSALLLELQAPDGRRLLGPLLMQRQPASSQPLPKPC